MRTVVGDRRLGLITLEAYFAASQGPKALPLVVSLDRTLWDFDVFHFQLSQLLLRSPWVIFWVLKIYLRKGLLDLKQAVFDRSELNKDRIPLNEKTLGLLAGLQATEIELLTDSCKTIAASASKRMSRVADSSSVTSLIEASGPSTAGYLRERYGEGGFFYIGDSRGDLVKGKYAAGIVLIDENGDLDQRPLALGRKLLIKTLQQIRAKHWVKNLLVFVPLIAAHEVFFEPIKLLTVFLLFGALSLIASSTYVFNDLIDFPDDLVNPLKFHRPLVSGAVSFPFAIGMSTSLFVGGFALAWLIGWRGILAVVAYLVLTVAYTVFLKRKIVLDVLGLSALYVLRIFVGGFVLGITLSSWLLLFAFFIFFSIAWVKRYTETLTLGASGYDQIPGRPYRAADSTVISVIGITSGFTAVLVYSLYIAVETVQELYVNPQILLLGVPVLVLWLCLLWIRAFRLEIDADPIEWASRDPFSLATALLFLLIFLAAALNAGF